MSHDSLDAAELDELVARIVASWSELLHIEGVCPDDDFFDLGGTSLTFIRFIGWVQDAFDVVLPLDELFADDLTPTATARVILAGWDGHSTTTVGAS